MPSTIAVAAPVRSRVRLRAGCLAEKTVLAFCCAAVIFLTFCGGALLGASTWFAVGCGRASGSVRSKQEPFYIAPSPSGRRLGWGRAVGRESGERVAAMGAGLTGAPLRGGASSSVSSSADMVGSMRAGTVFLSSIGEGSKSGVMGGKSLAPVASTCPAVSFRGGREGSVPGAVTGFGVASAPPGWPDCSAFGTGFPCLARSAFFSASISRLMVWPPPPWLVQARG